MKTKVRDHHLSFPHLANLKAPFEEMESSKTATKSENRMAKGGEE